MEPLDPHLRRVFQPRQRRGLLSFRRRRDLVFFVVCLSGLLIGLISLAVALVVVNRRSAPAPDPSAEAVEPPPLETPPPAPPPFTAPTPAEPVNPTEATPPPAPISSEINAPPPSPTVDGEDGAGSPDPDKKTIPPLAATKPADFPRLASPYVLLSNNRPMKIDADTTSEIIAETIVGGGQPALKIRYQLVQGRWVRVSYKTPADLRGARSVSLAFRVEGKVNTIEFGVIDDDGTVASVAWSKISESTVWATEEVPVENLALSGGDGTMDWSHVRTMYVRISKARGVKGGKGTVLVRAIKIL